MKSPSKNKNPNKKKTQRQKKESKTHNTQQALRLFAEAGLLKRIKRSGWWVAGIKDPESVAEHSFRCALIAYYLARQEQQHPYAAVMMALFNDIHESRINDLHKMGHFYIDFKAAEKKVFHDQIKGLDPNIQAELLSLRQSYDQQLSLESLIARDADILECLLQAKEYAQDGYPKAKIFLTRAPKYLKTSSAKALWQQLKTLDTAQWWQTVVKFER